MSSDEMNSEDSVDVSIGDPGKKIKVSFNMRLHTPQNYQKNMMITILQNEFCAENISVEEVVLTAPEIQEVNSDQGA